MELIKPFSFAENEIEIIEPTKVKAYSNGDHVYDKNDHKYINFIQKPNQKFTYQQYSKSAQSDELFEEDNEDYLVIDLLEDDGIASGTVADDDDDAYVDIKLKSSKQIMIYLTKKPRLFIRCHDRAVNMVSASEQETSDQFVVFLKHTYRLTISKTEFWYYNYCHTIYLHPKRNNKKMRPIRYTEKVEMKDNCLNSSNEKKTNDLSGYQLTFVNESNHEISKLTLSSDFTLSFEEKPRKLDEISTDIDISSEDADLRPLKRSYSIEFLNEEKEISPFSVDNISSRIEKGEGYEISIDSNTEHEGSVVSSYDEQKSTLKRSYSIEFLNEHDDEQQAFSAEIVSYQINEGKGTLVYSELEQNDEYSVSANSSTNTNGIDCSNRSYNIEFINEQEKQKSEFNYETISSGVEKREVRLINSASRPNIEPMRRGKSLKPSSSKLKTLNIRMNVNDDDEQVPLSNEKRAYSIEFLHEIDDEIVPLPSEEVQSSHISDTESVVEDEIIVSEAVDDEQEPQFNTPFEKNSLGLQPKVVDIDIDENDNDDLLQYKQAYNIKFLDEKPDMQLVFEENQTSTPVKKSSTLESPRKSPLQTISINLEFEKRNRRAENDDELFINDADDYLVYEESKNGHGNSSKNGCHDDWSALKLKTINVDMEAHHKRRRSSLLTGKNFRLEFQTERERRISLMKARKERPASDSSGPLRTVSVETEPEEVLDNEPEPTPRLLKKKWYSVEMLNETDGDKSVFAEEIDDGECRWTIDV